MSESGCKVPPAGPALQPGQRAVNGFIAGISRNNSRTRQIPAKAFPGRVVVMPLTNELKELVGEHGLEP